MENEQYEQQMQWEADQNAEGEAMAAQAEIPQKCIDCGRKNDGGNCIAGGVHIDMDDIEKQKEFIIKITR